MRSRNDGWREDAALDKVRARTRLVVFWMIIAAFGAMGLWHIEAGAIQSITNALASVHP